MRNLTFLALLACAPDGTPLASDTLAAKGEAPKGEVPPDVIATCLGEDCGAVWLSLDPPAREPATWWIDGEEAGQGIGLKLAPPFRGVQVSVDTASGSAEAAVTAATTEDEQPSTYVVIQTYRSCDEFRVVTVGGCITGSSHVRFDTMNFSNPYAPGPTSPSVAFQIANPDASLVDLGFAWGAWWPEQGAQRVSTAWVPPGLNAPQNTNTGTSGLEFRHAVSPGQLVQLRVVHGGSGTHQNQLYTAVCSDQGVPGLVAGITAQ